MVKTLIDGTVMAPHAIYTQADASYMYEFSLYHFISCPIKHVFGE